MQSSNCSNLPTTITNYNSLSTDSQPCKITRNPVVTNIRELKLNQVFVKTAHDCCCSGDYKNDYVDLCALKNCRNQGARALDFQIYSLKGEPIIASSSISGIKYKEMYNSLDMYTTMKEVKRLFLTSECSNFSDPLFLIFRVNSSLKATYDKMYSILVEIFGTGSSTGNMIYVNITETELSTITLTNFINKVVICVYSYEQSLFISSTLAQITSLNLTSTDSKIYYETDLLDLQLTHTPAATDDYYSNANILFPNRQASSVNMDFVQPGLYFGITFMGMNFQHSDNNLTAYNCFFKQGPFIEKDPTGIANSNGDGTYAPLYTISNKIVIIPGC